jgi:hypothetical protein
MLLTLLLSGCLYDEQLPQIDITGKVVIPAAALTRTTVAATTTDTDGDGVPDETTLTPGTEPVTDVRLIGPVYLGAFSGIDTESFDYPHPTMGPIVTADYPGDTFPYGGTTVGRLDFACYEALSCRVSTGRFKSYDEILSYFKDELGRPVTDSHGVEITDASVFQQKCYEYFYATSDQEMSFLGDADFKVNADGDYEADFVMPHTTWVEGMVIWGWMDAPQIGTDNTDSNGSFSTCEPNGGRRFQEYDQDYYEGRPKYDLLNYPSLSIYQGDWVADGNAVMSSPDDTPTVNLTVNIPEEE